MIRFDSCPFPSTSQPSPCSMSLISTYLKYTAELYKLQSSLIYYTVFTQMQDKVSSLKFGTEICVVMLNSFLKRWTLPCWTWSLWTAPCGAKPWPASPDCVRSALFWDITQCRVLIPHHRFGTTYHSQLQGSRNPKERTQHERSYLTSSFMGLWSSIFLKTHSVQKLALFSVFRQGIS